MASLFAQTLAEEGVAGAEQLRALVFTVIAATVLVQGLTGGMVARWLGLRRPSGQGWAILGANELGRALGRLLSAQGEDVVLLDNDSEATRLAEADELRVVFGNALEERTLQRARLDERRGCIAATANVEVNLLFAREAADEFKVPRDPRRPAPDTVELPAEGRRADGRPRALRAAARPRAVDRPVAARDCRRSSAGFWATSPSRPGPRTTRLEDGFDFPESSRFRSSYAGRRCDR